MACSLECTDIQAMRKKVDQLVKPLVKRGVLDEWDLVKKLSTLQINPADVGHLTIVGYIINKYINDIGEHDMVKAFLRQVNINLLKPIVGVIPVQHKNGSLFFRKFTGYST